MSKKREIRDLFGTPIKENDLVVFRRDDAYHLVVGEVTNNNVFPTKKKGEEVIRVFVRWNGYPIHDYYSDECANNVIVVPDKLAAKYRKKYARWEKEEKRRQKNN